MMNNKITIKEAIKLFCNECQNYGLSVTEDSIIANGKKQRCPVIQSRHSKTSGCYILHASNNNDFPFNGFIFNFNTGEGNKKWNVMPYIGRNYLSTTNSKFSYTQSIFKNNIEQENRFKKIAHIAYKIYQQSNKYPTGPSYLDIKQVKPFGVKFQSYKDEDNIVVVPGRDLDGKIWTLQLITAKNVKHFLKNGKLNGLCHKIGFINLPNEYDKNIMICEGYATGASIHMATSHPTICAFNSGNLPNVGILVKERWPNAKIIYCADIDYVGINKAIQAKQLTSGIIIVPLFNNSKEADLTDFNDLHYSMGLAEVKQQILLQIEHSDSYIDTKAECLFENIINEDEIVAQLIPVVEILIKIYFTRKFAKSLIKIEHHQQLEALHYINPNYRALTINAFIIEEATRIFNINSLEKRRAEIKNIYPEFQDLVKQHLKQLWSEKYQL